MLGELSDRHGFHGSLVSEIFRLLSPFGSFSLELLGVYGVAGVYLREGKL